MKIRNIVFLRINPNIFYINFKLLLVRHVKRNIRKLTVQNYIICLCNKLLFINILKPHSKKCKRKILFIE
jgi:hypothetical protein